MEEGPPLVETREMESWETHTFFWPFHFYSSRSLDIQRSKIKPIRVSRNSSKGRRSSSSSSSSSSDMADPAATIRPWAYFDATTFEFEPLVYPVGSNWWHLIGSHSVIPPTCAAFHIHRAHLSMVWSPLCAPMRDQSTGVDWNVCLKARVRRWLAERAMHRSHRHVRSKSRKMSSSSSSDEELQMRRKNLPKSSSERHQRRRRPSSHSDHHSMCSNPGQCTAQCHSKVPVSMSLMTGSLDRAHPHVWSPSWAAPFQPMVPYDPVVCAPRYYCSPVSMSPCPPLAAPTPTLPAAVPVANQPLQCQVKQQTVNGSFHANNYDFLKKKKIKKILIMIIKNQCVCKTFQVEGTQLSICPSHALKFDLFSTLVEAVSERGGSNFGAVFNVLFPSCRPSARRATELSDEWP